jgi:hypothetical protein
VIEYATVTNLQNWLPPATTVPDDASQLLRSATLLVARAINESPYATSTVTTDARRDATCAQVQAWLDSGIRPGAGGLQSSPVVKSKGVGTARKEFDTSLEASVTAFQKRSEVAEKLCPEAEAILRAAGLLWVPVALFSGSSAECVASGAEAPFSNGYTGDWWR